MTDWTTISITKPAARWLNAIKGVIEYHTGGKYTLSYALVIICAMVDYDIAKEAGTLKEGEKFIEFMLRRAKVFMDVDTEQEMASTLEQLQIFGNR